MVTVEATMKTQRAVGMATTRRAWPGVHGPCSRPICQSDEDDDGYEHGDNDGDCSDSNDGMAVVRVVLAMRAMMTMIDDGTMPIYIMTAIGGHCEG